MTQKLSGITSGGPCTTAAAADRPWLALSALDIALWDLKARRANVPLLRLLGGFDARVPCYAGGIDLDLSVEALLQQTDDNRSTLICCLSTRISASTANRDRNKSLAIQKISRHKSCIGYQHRPILSQLPARLNLRQGQPVNRHYGPFSWSVVVIF
jgi:hypothetical protein